MTDRYSPGVGRSQYQRRSTPSYPSHLPPWQQLRIFHRFISISRHSQHSKPSKPDKFAKTTQSINPPQHTTKQAPKQAPKQQYLYSESSKYAPPASQQPTKKGYNFNDVTRQQVEEYELQQRERLQSSNKSEPKSKPSPRAPASVASQQQNAFLRLKQMASDQYDSDLQNLPPEDFIQQTKKVEDAYKRNLDYMDTALDEFQDVFQADTDDEELYNVLYDLRSMEGLPVAFPENLEEFAILQREIRQSNTPEEELPSTMKDLISQQDVDKLNAMSPPELKKHLREVDFALASRRLERLERESAPPDLTKTDEYDKNFFLSNQMPQLHKLDPSLADPDNGFKLIGTQSNVDDFERILASITDDVSNQMPYYEFIHESLGRKPLHELSLQEIQDFNARAAKYGIEDAALTDEELNDATSFKSEQEFYTNVLQEVSHYNKIHKKPLPLVDPKTLQRIPGNVMRQHINESLYGDPQAYLPPEYIEKYGPKDQKDNDLSDEHYDQLRILISRQRDEMRELLRSKMRENGQNHATDYEKLEKLLANVDIENERIHNMSLGQDIVNSFATLAKNKTAITGAPAWKGSVPPTWFEQNVADDDEEQPDVFDVLSQVEDPSNHQDISKAFEQYSKEKSKKGELIEPDVYLDVIQRQHLQ